MTLKTILRFQFGNADTIREVAQSRAALPTEIILILLTSIAHNYDQTFILEKPFLWLFGSLLFSIGSATLIFGIIYLAEVRNRFQNLSCWNDWPSNSTLASNGSFSD